MGELQKALNDAAGKASLLWTTFVTFALYLAIAFGSVTHRDLLLENPIKLPVLNVDLPLTAFFVVAPTLLLIFHFYVFLQLLALAMKAKDYNKLLKQRAPSAADRQLLRQRLDAFFVLQFLAGPQEQRAGFSGLCLRLIAWLTLVGTPVLIMLQGQVTFLPYHHSGLVWLQRFVIILDLAVIWYFWDRVRSEDTLIIRRIPSRVWRGVGVTLSISVGVFSIGIATFPGESVDEPFGDFRWIPNPEHWSTDDEWTSLHELLFMGAVNEVNGRPRSLFSNRLVLTDQSLIDPAKLAKTDVSHSFRGRDLRRAVFNRADLRKADFTGAMLNEASLDGAKLTGAQFKCADTGRRSDAADKADSQPTAAANGPTGPWPVDGCTWLQGARLREAQLQAALLPGAHLQGAAIDFARLSGAVLNNADLQGASLYLSDLVGATLYGTQLQAAMLDRTDLQGAQFNGANLQGATLMSAEAQGTLFGGTSARATLFDDTSVWRAQPPNSDSGAVVRSPETNARYRALECPSTRCDWSATEVSKLKDRATAEIPSGPRRDVVLQRIADLDPAPRKNDGALADAWMALKAASNASAAKFEQTHADEWRVAGCAAAGAPYVIHGFLSLQVAGPPTKGFRIDGPQSPDVAGRLAGAFLDEAQCPGALGLSREDKERLRTIRAAGKSSGSG